MPLGMQVGVGSGGFVFDGTQLSPEKRHTNPTQFLAHVYCGQNGWMDQDASWYGGKRRPMRRCVRWGRSSLLKGAQAPVFGSCLLWPNGSMDEDATWYLTRPRPRPHCVRRGPSSPRKGHSGPSLFLAHVYCCHSRPSQLLPSSCSVCQHDNFRDKTCLLGALYKHLARVRISRLKVKGERSRSPWTKAKKYGILFASRPLGRSPRAAFFSGAVLGYA